jgi:hypothetical protein
MASDVAPPLDGVDVATPPEGTDVALPLEGVSEPQEQAMVTNTRMKNIKVSNVLLLGLMLSSL